MKTTRYTLMITAAMLALSACTQNDVTNGNILPDGEYPLVIKATGLNTATTRATVDGDWVGVADLAIQTGGVTKKYTVTPDAGNTTATLQSAEGQDPFYWTSRDDITVTAWWPYTEVNGTLTEPAVVVKQIQSDIADFQASDYIRAHSTAVKFENPTLQFTHRTARISITLVKGTGIKDLTGVTVSLTGLSTENGNPSSVTPYASNGTYDALVAPQSIQANTTFITVLLNGGTYSYTPTADIKLKEGYRYNYNVTVNSKELVLTGCTITAWTESPKEDIAAGIADFTYDNASDTYTVFTYEGLKTWAKAVEDGNYDANCTLANDILFPAATKGAGNWEPVGNGTKPYSGTFDGGSHTITGVTINLPTQDYVGFFGAVGTSGVVKNLKLADVDIKGMDYVRGIAGDKATSAFEGCSVTGTVSGTGSYVETISTPEE